MFLSQHGKEDRLANGREKKEWIDFSGNLFSVLVHYKLILVSLPNPCCEQCTQILLWLRRKHISVCVCTHKGNARCKGNRFKSSFGISLHVSLAAKKLFFFVLRFCFVVLFCVTCHTVFFFLYIDLRRTEQALVCEQVQMSHHPPWCWSEYGLVLAHSWPRCGVGLAFVSKN